MIFVGKKLKLDNFWPHPTGLALLAVPYWPCMVKMFVRCKTKDLKEYILKFWAQSMQLLQRSCLGKILAVPYLPCMVKIFIICKTKDHKEDFLKCWAKSIQPLTIKWWYFYPNINDCEGVQSAPPIFLPNECSDKKKTEHSI